MSCLDNLVFSPRQRIATRNPLHFKGISGGFSGPKPDKSAISPKESHYLFLSGAVQSNSNSGESYGFVSVSKYYKGEKEE